MGYEARTAFPVNAVSAALIIADKTDVRENRVRSKDMSTFDIHDRVNFAVKKSEVILEEGEILLKLHVDTNVCSVMDYFEIFMERMRLCRKAAEKLGQIFAFEINGQKMM